MGKGKFAIFSQFIREIIGKNAKNSKILSKIGFKISPNFVKNLAKYLLKIWQKICRKYGQTFVENLAKNLSKIWPKFFRQFA